MDFAELWIIACLGVWWVSAVLRCLVCFWVFCGVPVCLVVSCDFGFCCLVCCCLLVWYCSSVWCFDVFFVFCCGFGRFLWFPCFVWFVLYLPVTMVTVDLVFREGLV